MYLCLTKIASGKRLVRCQTCPETARWKPDRSRRCSGVRLSCTDLRLCCFLLGLLRGRTCTARSNQYHRIWLVLQSPAETVPGHLHPGSTIPFRDRKSEEHTSELQ